MTDKKHGVSPKKSSRFPRLQAIRVGEIKPSLQTLSSTDCGVDLSGSAFAGLKKWK